jgi:hypothetical protein
MSLQAFRILHRAGSAMQSALMEIKRESTASVRFSRPDRAVRTNPTPVNLFLSKF